MATLRDIRRRIRSVQSTRQITKAMEMVAAAKLRKAQARVHDARAYAEGMVQVLAACAAASDAHGHPLLARREVKRRGLIVIASDRGLCGAYNTNLMRAADEYLQESGGAARFYPVGRKAAEYLARRKRDMGEPVTDLPALADLRSLRELASRVEREFTAGGPGSESRVDQVDLLYTRFKSTMRREVRIERFLPISIEDALAGVARTRDFLIEPSPAEMFRGLLPHYARTRLYIALAEANASEHSARMVAMGAANTNAGEMIDRLTLTRNRLRQAVITKEIAEIVGGAEALA